MVHLARPVLHHVPAVRREAGGAQSGELRISRQAGLPAVISWRPAGGDPVDLLPPYRLDRVELRHSPRARLHGLTAGVRLVTAGWSPLFLVPPSGLPALALAAASTRRVQI
ncbi:hypothetical protein [Kitasatospora phosalacinea]|uniref:Uncharacterized protein n=1 Tax=Kitasatospora phosalacinea TaxID=2065 RepID=A0A9W6UPH4_9ACTN|nr:hypothetical protein [Kitasatospora phosalacinea]GLW55348.1 hypothetical protein Kpho01_33590 [Kitasatospora phosalacinea]